MCREREWEFFKCVMHIMQRVMIFVLLFVRRGSLADVQSETEATFGPGDFSPYRTPPPHSSRRAGCLTLTHPVTRRTYTVEPHCSLHVSQFSRLFSVFTKSFSGQQLQETNDRDHCPFLHSFVFSIHDIRNSSPIKVSNVLPRR